MPLVAAYIKRGENIPLQVVMGNGSTDRVIKATLYDAKTHTAFATDVILAHITNGFYFDDSVPLPDNVSLVNAIYRVFESDGVSPSADTEKRAEDFFQVQLDGIFECELTGFVEPGEVVGVVESDGALSGLIEQDELSGEVTDGTISGELSSDELVGKTEDCP